MGSTTQVTRKMMVGAIDRVWLLVSQKTVRKRVESLPSVVVSPAMVMAMVVIMDGLKMKVFVR